jgi:hypothetical protein
LTVFPLAASQDEDQRFVADSQGEDPSAEQNDSPRTISLPFVIIGTPVTAVAF